MERMRPPKLDERPVPVIPDDTIRSVLTVCSGRSFEGRRDTAILFVLIDTGARLSEVADLRLDEDLDLEFDELQVTGKGRRGCTLPLGNRAMKAMDRYRRARVRHKAEELHWLWVGPKGRLTKSGIAQMLRRRYRQAGVEQVSLLPVPAHIRAQVAVEGRRGGRSDAACRMALESDGSEIRALVSVRTGKGRPQETCPRRRFLTLHVRQAAQQISHRYLAKPSHCSSPRASPLRVRDAR
jgi:integrase